MKNIKTILLLMLPMIFVSASVCECGDYNTGTTVYLVNTGGDCCDKNSTVDPLLPGYHNTWIQQSNGVWQIDNSTVTTTAEAQAKCCN